MTIDASRITSALGGPLISITDRKGDFVWNTPYADSSFLYTSFPHETQIVFEYACGTVETYKAFNDFQVHWTVQDMNQIVESWTGASFKVGDRTYQLYHVRWDSSIPIDRNFAGLDLETKKRVVELLRNS